MKSYPVKTPKIVQDIFKSFIWSFPTDKKEIYLTFDDGPIPEITPWVLNILSEYKAKATFFCIGDNVKKHPQIFQKIIKESHSIGNHTYNHVSGWKTNNKEYLNNVEKAEKIITHSKLKTQNSKLIFRPPYGRIKPSQAKKIIKKGYKIIMWDVLSGDFDGSLPKEDCFKNVIKNTNKGSIIVFHDSEKAFKNLQYTLPKTLEFFTKKGFVFKAI